VDSVTGSLSIPREGSQPGEGRGAAGSGVLGEAVRNIERYAPPEKFQNLGGGAGEYGPYIQFDTKGVDFGPWIRRFIAQIKRNWLIPYAAMSMKGHVVITFYVHRDGRITELGVPGPSAVEAFNNAAYNALAWSNPTATLPPEYPDDRAFFTVTFFYNETPPQE
jgi:TonB family protein